MEKMTDTESARPESKEMVIQHDRVEQHPNTPAATIALHHDIVAPEAIGGLYEDLPKGYYLSKGFLGTLIVCFGSGA